MSVILYDEDKFLRLCETLKVKGQEIAYVWKYPEGWDKPGNMNPHIEAFVEDLYQANIRCWNHQYNEEVEIKPFEFHTVIPSNDFQLAKDLQSLRYNIADNSGEDYNFPDTRERLDHLIEHTLSEIVERLPQYVNAEW